MEALLTALKAVAEPTRLRLIALCARSDLTVSELTQILGQTQPRISRHLKLLADADVLIRYREGAWVFHRLTQSGPMSEFANHLVGLLPEDDEQLKRDLEHLNGVRKKRTEAAAKYFSKIAPQWDQVRSLHIEDSKVEEALVGLLDDDVESLLDIGTGTGQMLKLFGPLVTRAEGVDMSREMLAVARVNLEQAGLKNCSVRESDMYLLPYQNNSFQVCVIHQVLHFSDDPGRAIAEVERVLKPGGSLLVCDFAPHDLQALRDEHAHRRLGFSDKEVSDWFTGVGLACNEIIHLPGDPVTVTIWHGRKLQ